MASTTYNIRNVVNPSAQSPNVNPIEHSCAEKEDFQYKQI